MEWQKKILQKSTKHLKLKSILLKLFQRTEKRDYVKIYSMRLGLIRQQIIQRHNNTKLTYKPVFLMNTYIKINKILSAHQKYQTS